MGIFFKLPDICFDIKQWQAIKLTAASTTIKTHQNKNRTKIRFVSITFSDKCLIRKNLCWSNRQNWRLEKYENNYPNRSVVKFLCSRAAFCLNSSHIHIIICTITLVFYCELTNNVYFCCFFRIKIWLASGLSNQFNTIA